MSAVIAILALLMLELAVGLVLLGTWIAEGRRRSEEIERIEGLLRRAGVGDGDQPTDATGVSRLPSASPDLLRQSERVPPADLGGRG